MEENALVETTSARLDRTAWAEHIERWQAQGTTVAQYCRETGIATHRFRYWRDRLGSASGGFVRIDPPSSAPEGLWLEWGTRHRVHLGRDFDLETLRRVLEATGAR